MNYSIPYVILMLLLGGAAILYDNIENNDILKKRITIFSVIVFFIFFGFRGYIMSDWIVYYPFFRDCELGDLIDIKFGTAEYIEPGIVFVALLCKLLFNNFHFFIAVLTAIELVLLIRFFHKQKIYNLALALLVFTTFSGLGLIVNLLRNFIAILIFLNSLEYIENKRMLQYFGSCLLALFFHTSSLLFFPLYFFINRRYNKWLFLAIFITCNVVFLLHIHILTSFISLLGVNEFLVQKIKAYTEDYVGGLGFSIGYLERLFTGFLVYIYYDKLCDMRKNGAIFINALIIYFVIFFFFSDFDVVSKRIANLFAFGYWIVWIDLIKCFAIDNNRRLFKIFIVLYCVLRMHGSVSTSRDFEYDNVLFGARSYNERLYIYNKTPHDM